MNSIYSIMSHRKTAIYRKFIMVPLNLTRILSIIVVSIIGWKTLAFACLGESMFVFFVTAAWGFLLFVISFLAACSLFSFLVKVRVAEWGRGRGMGYNETVEYIAEVGSEELEFQLAVDEESWRDED